MVAGRDMGGPSGTNTEAVFEGDVSEVVEEFVYPRKPVTCDNYLSCEEKRSLCISLYDQSIVI